MTVDQTLGIKKGEMFSHPFLLSKDIYEGFLRLFKDENVLHVNEAFAHSKGFKDKVMHGNILGGFLSYFVGECLPMKNVIIHFQEIKFMKPVYLNDSLMFRAEVADVFESVSAFELKFTFSNQEQVKVAKGSIQIGVL